MFEFVIKIEDNSPVGNPITASNFFNTNKVKSLSISQLNEMGYAPFALVNPPIAGLKQKLQDNGLILDDDGFVKKSYELVDRSQEEIDADELSNEVRKERNELLAESDWTQFNDSPLSDSDKTLWSTYRQELRDISSQENFPFEITWPEKP
jgi:hypothetical protein